MKATAILTIQEVRNALDLENDSIQDGEAQELSQRVSDFIFRRTGKNWGQSSSLAKICAEFVAIDMYYRSADHQKTIDMYLADLIDIAHEEKGEEQDGTTR